MTFALLYCILLLAWLLFGLRSNWPKAGEGFGGLSGTVILFVLFVLLGWKVFGPLLRE